MAVIVPKESGLVIRDRRMSATSYMDSPCQQQQQSGGGEHRWGIYLLLHCEKQLTFIPLK